MDFDDNAIRAFTWFALAFALAGAAWILGSMPAAAAPWPRDTLAAACFAESGWRPDECRNAIVPTYVRRFERFQRLGRRVSLSGVVRGHSRPLRPKRAPVGRRDAFARALPASIDWAGYRRYRARYRALLDAVDRYRAGDWLDWCPGSIDIGGPRDKPPRHVEPADCNRETASRFYRLRLIADRIES
jgi:hypothetical protein